MFGASLRTFGRFYRIDAGRSTIVRSIVNGGSRVQVIVALGDSTRPLISTQRNALTCGVLNKCTPPLLPINVSTVATRLYATDKTDNEQKSGSIKEDTKSQSILTRLLEEEQRQPKALTVAERGVY